MYFSKGLKSVWSELECDLNNLKKNRHHNLTGLMGDKNTTFFGLSALKIPKNR
jgi:hypothetical protein